MKKMIKQRHYRNKQILIFVEAKSIPHEPLEYLQLFLKLNYNQKAN